jgi:hypothetical protein
VNGERNRSFGKGKESGIGKTKRKEGGWHEKGKGKSKRERIMDVMISNNKLVDISG